MKIYFPIIELIDRYVIASIKQEKIGENLAEFEYYHQQIALMDLELIKKDIDDLREIHLSIWELEKDLKSGKESSLPLEEIGRRAISIRDLNNQRIAVKNRVAEKLSCPIREIKKDHLSE